MTRKLEYENLEDLSEQDLRYLRDRGSLTAEQEQELLSDDLEDVGTGPEPGLRCLGSNHYDQMNKKDLQEELGDRELPKSGGVDELRDRLRQADLDEAEAGQ